MTIEPELDVHDIQGHSLRGFSTPYLCLLGIRIDAAAAAKSWLAALSSRIDTLARVHNYRVTRSFAPVRAPRVLLNLAMSARGLEKVGTDLSDVEDGLFLSPMGASAGLLGDAVDASQNPTEYVTGATWDTTPDVLLIIGGDTLEATATFAASLRAAAAMGGGTVIFEQPGNRLPGDIEHFGFRDGISQVGPRGRLSNVADDYLTLRFLAPADPNAELFAKPGRPLVWPGQFVFGYPTQLPATPEQPGPLADGGAGWMKNGSFLVFRRLRQDVPAFLSFLKRTAADLTRALGRPVSNDEAGMLIVGRWMDGTPSVISPERPDEAVAGDELLVNHFAFGQGTPAMTVVLPGGERIVAAQPDDHLALRCPHFAHIRKVNPRDLFTDQGIAGRTLTFQMLRRGMPYGPVFGAGTEHDERGLLFLAYQTSFKRQFQVLNSLWANNPSAPEMTDEGHDLLIGQSAAGSERVGTLRDATSAPVATITTRDRWVIATGGGFFFAPSVTFLKALQPGP